MLNIVYESMSLNYADFFYMSEHVFCERDTKITAREKLKQIQQEYLRQKEEKIRLIGKIK